MAHVKGDIVPQFIKDGKLTLTVGLNQEDAEVTAKNQELLQQYTQYNVPIHLIATQASADNQSWNQMPVPWAIVMPPGAYLEFLYNYFCHLGYGFRIMIQPEGVVLADNLYVVKTAGSQTPDWLASGLRRFSSGPSTIQLIDWQNYQQYNIPALTADQAYLLEFTVWPIYSYSPNGDGSNPVTVPQSWLEQHYASGIGGGPTQGWQGDARKGHVLQGPASTQVFGNPIYDVQERKDLNTTLQFMALVVIPGNLADFDLVDLEQTGTLND